MEELKMRKFFTTAIILVMLMSLLINMNCKKTSVTEYTLSVVLNEGVTGTPETGNYTYHENDQVNYSFSTLEGYTGLTVYLDGDEVEVSGTITIQGNHVIEAYAGLGTGEFKLSIAVSTGAAGTPEAGVYYHDAGEQINYNYSLEDGYTNLYVTIDGESAEENGTLTISQDHTINVYCEKEYQIQGSWTLNETYEDGSAFEVTLIFDGEIENGTVIDSDGGTGTYTVSGRTVQFTIYYPEVTYIYEGNFYDEENMTGNAKRYVTEHTYKRGTWSAEKITD
jgi:hypothetical protein